MFDKINKLLNNFKHFFNPFSRLGKSKYSSTVPLTFTVLAAFLTEMYATNFLDNPSQRGIIAIFLFIALIVYFSFRDGIIGGFTATSVTFLYYFYIVYVTDGPIEESLRMVVLFGIAYYLIALTIGWLRQSVDKLIAKEKDDRLRLNAVVKQLPVGVIITDVDGTVELANRQAEDILGIKIPGGYKPKNNYLVKTLRRANSVATPKVVLKQILNNKKSLVKGEYEIESQNGRRKYINVNTSKVQNKEGDIIAMATIFSDITEKKESELRKDDFVSMASHELKTPLTSMKLYLDSLDSYFNKIKKEKTNKAVDGIKMQVNRLELLVMELLDVSRLQTGKLSYSKENFVIEELIQETIDAIKTSKNSSYISLKSKHPIPVYADRLRISQVLINLISNAVKYSPENKEIQIKTKKEKNEVVISVKDHGIGIEKDQQQKIFDRLYQASGRYEKTYPGLGMGLFISKEIIKAHGGDIWVESKKGKGSTFFFCLPVEKKKRLPKRSNL